MDVFGRNFTVHNGLRSNVCGPWLLLLRCNSDCIHISGLSCTHTCFHGSNSVLIKTSPECRFNRLLCLSTRKFEVAHACNSHSCFSYGKPSNHKWNILNHQPKSITLVVSQESKLCIPPTRFMVKSTYPRSIGCSWFYVSPTPLVSVTSNTWEMPQGLL